MQAKDCSNQNETTTIRNKLITFDKEEYFRDELRKQKREFLLSKVKVPLRFVTEKYENINKLGQGTFGIVHKGRNKETGTFCALKTLILDNENEGFAITALREIKILRVLSHPNVIKLIEICMSKGNKSTHWKNSYCMVFEYCKHDLAALLGNKTVNISTGHIKNMISQILQGLYYVHSKGILHRDMKSANILLSEDGKIKLADFGLAKLFYESKKPGFRIKNTTHVVTLWYRPPELLLGDIYYGPSVDMWGVGCIMIEMWHREPFLKGTNEQGQLKAIINVCGSITPQVWKDVVQLELFHKFHLSQDEPRKLVNILKQKIDSSLAIDLIDKMLTLDPAKRIDADNALMHDFFYKGPEQRDIVNLIRQHCQYMERNTRKK